MLFLIKNHTDTLIEQTKTRPQETLETKMAKQMQTFSFSPRVKVNEVVKWLLAVSKFKAINFVFNLTNGNNSFSVLTPSHWNCENGEELINNLNELLDLRSKNSIG